MKGLKALIVEDELLIAETIKLYLNERGHTTVGIAISYDEAIQLIATTEADVVLIDIRLYGNKSGIDVANHLRNSAKSIPYIIVSSQYDINVIQAATHAGAAGYLTKPISKETLWSTIELAVLKSHEESPDNRYIDLKVSHGTHRIQLKDILYIESDHVYVKIICESSEFFCRYTLSDLLDKINQPEFIQCHRSYIINVKKVEHYDNAQIRINDKVIRLGGKYRDKVLEALG